jgi:hypothetical protein
MDDLSRYALHYMTDKAPYDGESGVYHFYTLRYHELLSSIREQAQRVLEVGIERGASLKMWRDYFPNAVIHGVDIADCREALDGEPRIAVHIGDVGSPVVRASLIAAGPFDVVIDDGSHELVHMRDTCLSLYPVTRWLYIIEDVHLEWFGAELQASVSGMAGRPEVLVSRTDGKRAAFIYDKRR